MWLVSLFRSVSGAKEAQEDINTFEKTPTSTTTPQIPTKEVFKQDVPEPPKKVVPLEELSVPKIETKSTSSSTSIDNLWKRYLEHSRKDEEEESDHPDCITGEGLMLFAQDLDVEPIDPIMLILFWKLKATKQYLFTKEEFVGGFKSQGCSSLDDIKKKLPMYRKDLLNHSEFKKFYVFVFDYSKGFNPNIKIIPAEVAIPTWQILLKDRYLDLEKWCEFIQNEYRKPISKDLWVQFLEFTKETGPHDDSGSWPIAVDEYCLWRSKQ